MPRVSPISTTDSRRVLVDRVAQSSYISRSTRLRDLLLYLCDRVIVDGAEEIHEQEVGSEVFGRAKHYDTASDNIVRVHASTLRKRLEQYFAEEGRDERVIIELPKGNYAPIFRERTLDEPPVPLPSLPELLPRVAPTAPKRNFKLTPVGVLAFLLACCTGFLFYRLEFFRSQPGASLPYAVRQFWSGVFQPGETTDIVLDDAALALFSELEGRTVSLSEYFDRSYLRSLNGKQDTSLTPELRSALVLKRQSSYSSAHLLWELSRTAAALDAKGTVRFARDYSFRDLKADRGVLLGNARSNPWIEPFQSRLSIRWEFDRSTATYYPVDISAGTANAARYHATGEHPDGYASVAFVPNLGGNGNFLILSATGGSAIGAAAAFLTDGESVHALINKIGTGPGNRVSYFEALLRFPSRSRLPRDATVVFCRSPRS